MKKSGGGGAHSPLRRAASNDSVMSTTQRRSNSATAFPTMNTVVHRATHATNAAVATRVTAKTKTSTKRETGIVDPHRSTPTSASELDREHWDSSHHFNLLEDVTDDDFTALEQQLWSLSHRQVMGALLERDRRIAALCTENAALRAKVNTVEGLREESQQTLQIQCAEYHALQREVELLRLQVSSLQSLCVERDALPLDSPGQQRGVGTTDTGLGSIQSQVRYIQEHPRRYLDAFRRMKERVAEQEHLVTNYRREYSRVLQLLKAHHSSPAPLHARDASYARAVAQKKATSATIPAIPATRGKASGGKDTTYAPLAHKHTIPPVMAAPKSQPPPTPERFGAPAASGSPVPASSSNRRSVTPNYAVDTKCTSLRKRSVTPLGNTSPTAAHSFLLSSSASPSLSRESSHISTRAHDTGAAQDRSYVVPVVHRSASTDNRVSKVSSTHGNHSQDRDRGSSSLCLGSQVVYHGMYGIIRYLGATPLGEGVWVGVELGALQPNKDASVAHDPYTEQFFPCSFREEGSVGMLCRPWELSSGSSTNHVPTSRLTVNMPTLLMATPYLNPTRTESSRDLTAASRLITPQYDVRTSQRSVAATSQRANFVVASIDAMTTSSQRHSV